MTHSALRSLLTNLIDYAGLFPPAGLSLEEALAKYSGYLAGEYEWALGRFVLPLARLPELEKIRGTAAAKIPLSFVGLQPDELKGLQLPADSVEIKVARPEQIAQAMRDLPRGYNASFEIPMGEIPVDAKLDDFLRAIADSGARAKIRTGGLTADMFPSGATIAHFLAAAARHKVAFKATAGLHHPVRAVHNFTYEPGSARGPMHGFVNVFFAACAVFHGAAESDAEHILDETSPEAFCINETHITAHGFSLSNEQIARARREFALSFGSCSFDDPIHDLKALGWL